MADSGKKIIRRELTGPFTQATHGKIKREGVGGAGIGEHPLTLWLITAVIIVYLYIRRSHLGIDTHPAGRKPLVKPSDRLPVIAIPGVSGPPVLPRA